MFHIVQISFFRDPAGRSPTQMLQDWPSLVSTAEVVRQADVAVTVVQACAQNETIIRNGVRYEFIGPTDEQALVRRVRSIKPSVVHVHGLNFAGAVQRLADALPETPIFLQDHADRVPRWWRRPALRRGLKRAAGISFCSLSQAAPFRQAKLIAAGTQVFEIAECTSTFCPGDREAARRLTQLPGDPAVLWVGHLDANKDPLTVLEGLDEVIEAYPGLQLSCCFASAPLLALVQAKVHADARLRDRVHLLGKVSHAQVQQLMQAADAFVLGSHREGSGYSLIEAIACGLPPVVTDIPSFRMLTDDGRIGALWTCGVARHFSKALIQVLQRPAAAERHRVRQYFEAELSAEAFGAKLLGAYRQLTERCRQLPVRL